MSGDARKVPQTPGEAIAEQMAFIEQGLREFEEFLEKHAAFSLWVEEHEAVDDE